MRPNTTQQEQNKARRGGLGPAPFLFSRHHSPPVLGVRGPFFQAQQGIASSAKRQASDPITPFLLCPGGRKLGITRGRKPGSTREKHPPPPVQSQSRPSRAQKGGRSRPPPFLKASVPASAPVPPPQAFLSTLPSVSASTPPLPAKYPAPLSPPRPAHSPQPRLALPAVLDILVDEPSNEHGHQGVVPGADEHEGQAEAHAQEGECPGQCKGDPASEPLAGFSLVPGAQKARVRWGREGLGQTWEATARARGSHTIISRSITGTWGLWVDEQPQTGPRPAPRSPHCPGPGPQALADHPDRGVLRAGVSGESWRQDLPG